MPYNRQLQCDHVLTDKRSSTRSAEAFYAFHHANAFEQRDGSICLDIAIYPDIAVLKTFELDNLRSGARPYDRPILKRCAGACLTPAQQSTAKWPSHAAVGRNHYTAHVYRAPVLGNFRNDEVLETAAGRQKQRAGVTATVG